jgi:hypothetical protein
MLLLLLLAKAQSYKHMHKELSYPMPSDGGLAEMHSSTAQAAASSHTKPMKQGGALSATLHCEKLPAVHQLILA